MTLVERLQQRLLGKLPEGAAFRRDSESWFFKLFGALALEFARVVDLAESLYTESLPWMSVALLPDWERVLRLPSTGTIAERQLAVAAKLVDQGGCSNPYYIALAATLGYEITITEYLPWRVGISTCVDPLIVTNWLFTWSVTYASGVNDALLEATLIAARPAHTYVHFIVDGDALVMDGDVVWIDGETFVFED